MAGMSTPYLDAHPEYSETLLRLGAERYSQIDGESFGLTIFEDGKVVWAHPYIPVHTGFSMSQAALFYYRKLRKGLKYKLRYRKNKNGSAYYKDVWLKPPKTKPHKNGKVEVILTPKSLGYPEAIRKARRGVVGLIPSPKVVRSGARSSPLRPSPESRNTGFTEVTERSSFSGDYFLSTTPRSRLLKERTWTGVRTPNFSKLRPSQYPVNPHTVSIRTVSQDGPYRETQDQRGKNIPGAGISKFYQVHIHKHTQYLPTPADPTHLPLALNKTIRRLIDQAGLGIEANLAQDLGTVGQIVGLIGHNAKKITDSIKNLKKGNFPKAIDSLFAGRSRKFKNGGPNHKRDLAENWLELQYGWKPLLNEIHGVFSSLDVFQDVGESFVQQVTASSSARLRKTTTYNHPSVSFTAKGLETIDTLTRAKITLRFKIESPLKAFLAQTGFTNPVNLAWELLPFSFVVDWFVPIGPFLETLSSWDGLNFLDGCQTIFTRQNAVSAIGGSNISPLDDTLTMGIDSAYRREWILLSRTRLSSFPKSSFPELKNGLSSVEHAANAVALLTASFRR